MNDEPTGDVLMDNALINDEATSLSTAAIVLGDVLIDNVRIDNVLVNDETDNVSYKRKDPELGVLFVHGIGHQKKGETLGWAGDPLFRWLENWIKGERSQDTSGQEKPSHNGGQEKSTDNGGDKSPVYLTSTSILHPISNEYGEAPPSARFWFQASEKASPDDRNWIVAESFWAEEFDPPSFSELVTFGLGIAPILVESTGIEVLERIFKVLRSRLDQVGERKGIFGGFFVRLQRDIVVLASLVFTLLGGLLLGVLGAVAQMLIIVLYLLGFFPPLRGMVTKIQLHLAGWLGDAYLVAASPVRYNAMVSKVRRDMDWLLRAQRHRGPCKAIAVIAHSGGAIVAHEALAGAHSERYWSKTYQEEPPLLITYGSGHSKEHKIKDLLPKNSFFFGATAIARFLLAVINLGILLALLFLELPVTIFGLAIDAGRLVWLLVGTLVLQLLLLGFGRKKMEEMSKGTPFKPEKPEELKWRDFLGTVDIVPDKCITPKGMPEKDTITTEVYNLHSLREDHGAYWQNKEEFVADVVCDLLDTAKGEDLAGIQDPKNREMLKEAKRRHRNRVTSYFGAGLILFWSLPLLWFSLGSWLINIGSPFREAATKPIESFMQLLGFDDFKLPPSDIWNVIMGAAIVALFVFLWQRGVVRNFWNWWTQTEEEAMFNRAISDPPVKERKAAAWFLWVSCIPPLVPPFILFLKALLTPPYVQSGAWAVLIVVLSAALFVSRSTWALIAWRGLWKGPDNIVQPTRGLVEGMVHFLERLAKHKWSLGLFVGLVLLFALLTWGLQVYLGPMINAVCQKEALDTLQRFYTAEEAYRMIASCTDAGRQTYFWSEVFDILVYPVVLAFASALGIMLGLHYIGERVSKAKWLAIIPLLYLFTDWSENISIMSMILMFPTHILAAEQFVGVITPIKWIVGALAGSLGAAGGVAAIILLMFGPRRQ